MRLTGPDSPRPGDFEQVRALGAEAYVHQREAGILSRSRFHPRWSIAYMITTCNMTPAALFVEYQRPIMMARKTEPHDKDNQKDLRERARIIIREAVEARLLRAIEGPRQLQEVLTAFWFNHFNVYAEK